MIGDKELEVWRCSKGLLYHWGMFQKTLHVNTSSVAISYHWRICITWGSLLPWVLAVIGWSFSYLHFPIQLCPADWLSKLGLCGTGFLPNSSGLHYVGHLSQTLCWWSIALGRRSCTDRSRYKLGLFRQHPIKRAARYRGGVRRKLGYIAMDDHSQEQSLWH